MHNGNKCINKPCCHCGCNLELNFDNTFPTSNITAQRNYNGQDHNLDNIIPMCDICNRSLRKNSKLLYK